MDTQHKWWIPCSTVSPFKDGLSWASALHLHCTWFFHDFPPMVQVANPMWMPPFFDTNKNTSHKASVRWKTMVTKTPSWWFRNPAHQLIWQISHYPLFTGLWYIPGDVGFLPSTVLLLVKNVFQIPFSKPQSLRWNDECPPRINDITTGRETIMLPPSQRDVYRFKSTNKYRTLTLVLAAPNDVPCCEASTPPRNQIVS